MILDGAAEIYSLATTILEIVGVKQSNIEELAGIKTTKIYQAILDSTTYLTKKKA